MSAVAANAAVLGRREVRVVKSFAVCVLFCSLLLCFFRLPNPSSHALAPSITPLSVPSPSLSMSTAGLSETVFRQRLYSVACASGPVSAILYAAGRNDV